MSNNYKKVYTHKMQSFFINLFMNLFFPFKYSESFTGCYKCYQILYQIENIQTQHRGSFCYVMWQYLWKGRKFIPKY